MNAEALTWRQFLAVWVVIAAVCWGGALLWNVTPPSNPAAPPVVVTVGR